jgi:hypothetical protein
LFHLGRRTRTDKIVVGAGGDIGGTDISCNFVVARQYTGPTGQKKMIIIHLGDTH